MLPAAEVFKSADFHRRRAYRENQKLKNAGDWLDCRSSNRLPPVKDSKGPPCARRLLLLHVVRHQCSSVTLPTTPKKDWCVAKVIDISPSCVATSL